jgi:methyltransferase (TIGR00027 family)
MAQPTTVTRLRSGRSSAAAEINAQMRAADATLFPGRRLVDDPYAHHFVSNSRYRLLRLGPRSAELGLRVFDHFYGGLLAEILLRGRYFEEVLTDAFGQGARQVVLLGAGYDATALRHPELRAAHFFEVDHPSTQRVKREVLDRLGADTSNITLVPVDFGRDPLAESLLAAGFDPAKPSVFAWLGVSYYLTDEAFRRVLTGLGALCAPGSTLVFDYMDPSVIDGTTSYAGARRASRAVQRRGESYRLGLTPAVIDDAATAAGFRVVESIRVPELVRRHGGARPYCRPDDYMGLVRLTRVG